MRAPGIAVCCFANSFNLLQEGVRDRALQCLTRLGYKVFIGTGASTVWGGIVIDPRAASLDLQAAFQNPEVDLVMTGLGGFTTNWSVRALNLDIARACSKPVCGYSDSTSLLLRLHQVTGRIMYYGPHYGSLGVSASDELSEWSIEGFRQIVEPQLTLRDICSTSVPRSWIPNEDWVSGNPEPLRVSYPPSVLYHGEAQGTLIAGHLNSLLLSLASGWCPLYDDCILAIETDLHCPMKQFIREFVTLLESPLAPRVRGIVIGRCQPAAKVTSEMLSAFLSEIPDIRHLPLVIDVPFGHTFPSYILPIGAPATLSATKPESFTLRFT